MCEKRCLVGSIIYDSEGKISNSGMREKGRYSSIVDVQKGDLNRDMGALYYILER